MVGLLHQQTQQSDWCAVRSVSAGKWTKNQMHWGGGAIVQTIHWMQEVRILPVLIVITCVCTFPTCDHYCICIGVGLKLGANWNLWQTMPLVQYLHTGGTIQYPHTHGSGRVGDNYTVRPHSDTCPRRTRLPLGLPIHTQCHHPRSSCAS